jgi:hypothetical protein
MNNKNNLQNQINIVNKTNTYLLSGSFVCMFSYLILLGLTSANVVTLRSVAKNVEDVKTELSTVELSYMTTENMMALESSQSTGFAQAENISYVNMNPQNDLNTVAVANINN